VLCATNGEQALAVAAGHPGKIDILVSDVVMPRMNGAELATNLARSRPGIQALFVSGHSSSVLERKGIANSAAVLQKPYPLGVLAAKLREKLQLETKARAAAAGAK